MKMPRSFCERPIRFSFKPKIIAHRRGAAFFVLRALDCTMCYTLGSIMVIMYLLAVDHIVLAFFEGTTQKLAVVDRSRYLAIVLVNDMLWCPWVSQRRFHLHLP